VVLHGGKCPTSYPGRFNQGQELTVTIGQGLIESQSCSACRGECRYVSGPARNDWF